MSEFFMDAINILFYCFFLSEAYLKPCTSGISTATTTSKSEADETLKWGLLLIPLATFCLGTWQVKSRIELSIEGWCGAVAT